MKLIVDRKRLDELRKALAEAHEDFKKYKWVWRSEGARFYQVRVPR